MAPQTVPSVFLSHSHRDKPVARRIARQMSAHGFQVWLDEDELRIGTGLTAVLRKEIETADVFLVVASEASADSPWVNIELEHARDHGKPVIPLFIDPVSTRERFRDHLGVEATTPQKFGSALRSLMRAILRRADIELAPPDPEVIRASLASVAREEQNL